MVEKQYKYVIVGGGMVAGYAVKGIREIDKEGSILMLSAEKDVPYERPALSKKLWLDEEFTEEDTFIFSPEEENVDIQFETIVNQIDRESHLVLLQDGTSYEYEQLLVATGGEPTTVDGPEDGNVFAFRELADYRNLSQISENNQHVLIVGGGYIGSELASSLTQNDTKVTMIFPEETLGESQFPSEITSEYEGTYKENGVELVKGRTVESYDKDGDKLTLKLDDGSEISGDAIVFGLGVTPRLSLAEASGLDVNDGVVVNEKLQTNDNRIWVAGDIAYYPDQILGQTRVEHVDHARNSGNQVGRNMAGANEPYNYTPYFYSIIFDISWQAVGVTDASLTTIVEKQGDGKVVYYLDDQDTPVGVLLWNVDAGVDEARNVLSNPPFDPNDLKGMIQVN